MAVIIDMDMPKNCKECILRYKDGDDCFDYRCIITDEKIDFSDDKRMADCSLKSTDEMIAEIENCSETYVVGWDGKRSKTAKEMKQDILEIINKYCKGGELE